VFCVSSRNRDAVSTHMELIATCHGWSYIIINRNSPGICFEFVKHCLSYRDKLGYVTAPSSSMVSFLFLVIIRCVRIFIISESLSRNVSKDLFLKLLPMIWRTICAYLRIESSDITINQERTRTVCFELWSRCDSQSLLLSRSKREAKYKKIIVPILRSFVSSWWRTKSSRPDDNEEPNDS